jgi:hypothetical protein
MKLSKKTTILLSSLAVASLAFTTIEKEEIKGWLLGGSEPTSYQISIVDDLSLKKKVATLKSTNLVTKNKFGTIMQTFSAKNYLEKEIRLTGWIKTKDVDDWAGMWMRVDGKKKYSLSFDNMENREIKGTTGWTKYHIDLYVPKTSNTISFGVLLSGTGEVWINAFHFGKNDLRDIKEKTTKKFPLEPTNINFKD